MNRHALSIIKKYICALSAILMFLCISCKQKNQPKVALSKIETGKYIKAVFPTDNGELNYRAYYPSDFDDKKSYPLFLFLHGAGERGEDNEAQLVHGSQLIADGMELYDAIAIFPQCPADDYWVRFSDESESGEFEVIADGAPSDAMGQVMKLISSELDKEYIDNQRIYVTGLSMGGMGTFDLLWRMPNTFAAGVPICGAGPISRADVMKSVPVRIYHGLDDNVVPVAKSKSMEMAIRNAGGSPQSFYYQGVGHDSWNNAFAEPDFLSWIFSQKRG